MKSLILGGFRQVHANHLQFTVGAEEEGGGALSSAKCSNAFCREAGEQGVQYKLLLLLPKSADMSVLLEIEVRLPAGPRLLVFGKLDLVL